MPSQTRYAGTAADDASVGDVAWTNPANAQAAPNGVYATSALANLQATHYLKLTNYGFTVPADARIDGVVVGDTHHCVNVFILDSSAPRLVKGGAIGSAARGAGQYWAVADETVLHGAANDNWNAAWTPADINASTFGCAVSAQALGGGDTASVDAVAITVYYTRPHAAIPVVVFRDPEPPHGALFMEYPDALRYGFKVRATQTGSMLISRASPNAARLVSLLSQGRPPLVTIEHPDGQLPFVGFVTLGKFRASDTHIPLMIADHTARLSLGATKTAAAKQIASGLLIAEVIGEMQDRSAPAIALNLSHLKAGPGVNRELRIEQGDSFLRSMEQDAGWEAFYTYNISPGGVETFLEWTSAQGVDRRAQEVLQEGRQLADVELAYDFMAGYQAATAVGGTGAFASRPTTTVKSAVRPAGGGGTIVLVPQTITDTQALQSRAQAALDAPENVARTLTGQIVETAIDRSAFGLGDIRQFRLPTAFFGVPTEIRARIVALGMDPASGLHDFVAVEAS